MFMQAQIWEKLESIASNLKSAERGRYVLATAMDNVPQSRKSSLRELCGDQYAQVMEILTSRPDDEGVGTWRTS